MCSRPELGFANFSASSLACALPSRSHVDGEGLLGGNEVWWGRGKVGGKVLTYLRDSCLLVSCQVLLLLVSFRTTAPQVAGRL